MGCCPQLTCYTSSPMPDVSARPPTAPPFRCPWPQILVTLASMSYHSCGMPAPLPGATAAAALGLHRAKVTCLLSAVRCQLPCTSLLSSCGQVLLLVSSCIEEQGPPERRDDRTLSSATTSAFSALLTQPLCGNRMIFQTRSYP